MVDPYVYEGTSVLVNKLNITDTDTLRCFEIEATAQRLAEGLPPIAMTERGYCDLHLHIFQDVYDWAGQVRTVDLSKGGDLFCRAAFVERELVARFTRIRDQKDLLASTPEAAMAEHLSELNAIHPFRDGNGRTNRAFLKASATQVNFPLLLTRIDPVEWHRASRESFRTGGSEGFRRIVSHCTSVD